MNRSRMRHATLTTVLAFALAAFPVPAFAYIDPNAGGLLFQILAPLAALFGAGVVFAREQIVRLFGNVRTRLAWWRK